MSEPETVGPGELEAFEHALHDAFHDDAVPGDVELDMKTLEPERTFVIRDDGAIVAGATTLSRTMTLPGGAAVPVGAVSGVGVRPGHTRRGHLGALMRRQLDEIHEAGESLAILWASEGAIYGRFGYGSATRRVTYELDRVRAAFRADAVLPPAPAQVARPAAALEDMRRAYERALPTRPGMLDRDDRWWERVLYDPEHRREGTGARRLAVQRDAGGEPAGYALYAVTDAWGDQGPEGGVKVREIVAATPEAQLGLWRYLLSIDLMRAVSWPQAPDHDPIVHALRSTDAVRRTLHAHGLWLRLVDAPAALAARDYSAPLDVVLELEDDFCAWNAGRYSLTNDGCEPTGREPDLVLAAEALGAAYLGATPLTALAGAGRVRERTPGALRAATAAFGGFAEPYCPEHF